MHLSLSSTLAVVALAAGAAAQQTTFPPPATTTASGPTSTKLPDLVAQLPRCALQCFSSAARDINCAPSNFACLCSNSDNLIAKVGPCAFLGCSSDELGRTSIPIPYVQGTQLTSLFLRVHRGYHPCAPDLRRGKQQPQPLGRRLGFQFGHFCPGHRRRADVARAEPQRCAGENGRGGRPAWRRRRVGCHGSVRLSQDEVGTRCWQVGTCNSTRQAVKA